MAAGRSQRARLMDMADAIRGIRAVIAGLDFAAFEEGWVMQRAVERGLEIISEASRHLPPEAKAAHAEIPWRRIADIGNVLRHAYQRVEPRLIWVILDEYLPALDDAVLAMLAALDEPPA